MAYTRVGPFTDNSATPPLSAATANAIEAGVTAANTHILSGTGIDLTGATDSTTAVQAFLTALADGSTVTVPNGAVIKLGATVTVAHRIRLTGPGEMRWTAGIANAAMLDVTVDGCHFDGLHLTNPNHLAAQTGNRTSGIHFQANSGRVTGCRIVGQQQAVNVEANGEWHDFVIANNIILDVPGSGDGPSNSTSAYGEDRGDGITVWGAAASIVGNRVAALVGTDARVGIHVEALGSYETTSYAHADSMCSISGNVVTGQFRRGIVNEGLTHAAITGNAVADATWWGFALIGTSHYSTVVGNTVMVTRQSSDGQGAAWTPTRCGVMVYDGVIGAVIANNVIECASGAAITSGVAFQVGSGSQSVDCTVSGNTILGNSNQLANGISIANASSRTRILNNTISGFSAAGITASLAGDFEVSGNYILGSSGTIGVYTSGSSSNMKIVGNTIRLCSSAVQAYFRSVWVSLVGNTIEQASVGVDLYGAATGTKANLVGNTFSTVTTPTTNMPSGYGNTGNL